MKNFSKKTVQCVQCGRICSVYGIYNHMKWHENELRRDLERSQKVEEHGIHSNSSCDYNKIRDDLFCKYCGKSCRNQNSLTQHEIL